MNIEFTKHDLNLSEIEVEIVKMIMKKKKFKKFAEFKYDISFFNSSKNSNLRKKKEDGLKFVFKKAICFLKEKFREENYSPDFKIDLEVLDQKFYEFYFKKISDKYGIPIECFYHFRNWKNRNSDLIPKSITKEYVSHLKLSQLFVENFEEYLNDKFLEEFNDFNKNKIKRMVNKWDKLIEDNGEEDGLNQIKTKLFKRGNKMPWTISEAKQALDDTLYYLQIS
jgi:hypothetical protein